MMMLTDSAGWFGALAGAVVGLVLGSFVGMASWRWPREEGWVSPSACPQCGHRLRARELIPVGSWLAQRGRTACCGRPLAWRYPLLEGGTGLLVAVVGWRYGIAPESALLAVLCCTLVLVSAIDLDCGLIPDGASLTVAATGVGWLWLWPPDSWGAPVLSVGQAGGVGVLLAWGYSRLRGRDMLGWGDVKLMAASAIWLPPRFIPAYLLISAAVGVLIGGVWRWRGGEEAFPFAPALAMALVVLIFWQAGTG